MCDSNRSHFKFKEKVRESFAFLIELGFSEISASPTLLIFKKGDVVVDIYHGRQSYEIGAGVSIFGAKYSILEILRANDREAYERFDYVTVTTLDGVGSAVETLSKEMKCHGKAALEGDLNFVAVLENEGKIWAENFALDVLARQLRPQASEAFRQKDYELSANLYSQMRERLSLVELKKMKFAKSYCNGS